MFAYFTDREYAEMTLSDMDIALQVLAIREVLERNRVAGLDRAQEIETLAAHAREAVGSHAEHLVDLHIEGLHFSVYQDAANSAAAVAMLAPLLETVFVRMFSHLGKSRTKVVDATSRETLTRADLWNPKLVFRSSGRAEDLVSGIKQVSDMSGLTPLLPADYETVLKALFAYRNNMLHNSFEWPEARLRSFTGQAAQWPATWFSKSSRGNDPWIFYMGDAFVDRCLALVGEILSAFGALVRPADDGAADTHATPVHPAV